MTTLVLNQCLHGYRDGHQLLAESKELSQISQQELLFQTDLSGAKVDEGFDSYITCYPLITDSIYAISKTWYAPEMSRPGCVWTQTFLVDFSDVGKINDLTSLCSKFTRPTINKYDSYAEPLELNFGNSSQFIIDNNYAKIADALYTNYNKTVVLSAKSSNQYEETIFNIWQDQWPRLRRNFTFCTGALSLKTIEGKEFDFQIVPQNSLYTIERQSKNILMLDLNLHLAIIWIEDLKGVSKEKLKSFLWTFGSDVNGERKNYKALIDVFLSIYASGQFNLSKIATIIKTHFPSEEDAKFLKTSLFSHNSIFHEFVREKDIIIFLIANNPSLKFVDDSELKSRTTELLKAGKLEFSDLLSGFSNNMGKTLLQDVWNLFDSKTIIELIEKYPELIDEIAENKSELFFTPSFWKLSINLQKKMLGSIFNFSGNLNISKIVEAVLNANSEIIFDFGKLYPTVTVHISLSWLNEGKDRIFLNNWAKTLFNYHELNTFKWYNSNIKNLSENVLTLLIENIDVLDMHRVNFSHKAWVTIYHKNNNTINYSFKLAAFGFQDKISGSEWLVAETLTKICHELINNKKKLSDFNIPTESHLEDDIYTPAQYFSRMIWGSPKKQNKFNDRIDYSLLQVVLYNFIKNKWSRQAFLYALKDDYLFTLMLQITFDSNKGIYFITDVINDLKRNKIDSFGNQIRILKDFTNKL